ncbi:MAG: type IX secretion system membrane protein PorP/SprF [Flavobacteriales bacterium]|nr:type IX secretion system membrane protein PorP/SprF [Flavobacteriales bacterium]
MRTTPIVAMCLLWATSEAQQLPQLSQYRSNDYLYIPAVAGSRPLFEMRSAHRNQWVGITDAPRTFMLGVTTPVGAKMGIGGSVFTDNVGPTRRTGFQLTYAYHLRLTKELKFSLSLSGGMLQYLVDGSKITFNDPNETAIDGQLRDDLVPDMTFSLLLYHPRYWFGFTAPQLLRNKLYFFDDRDGTMNTLERHYFATAGYKFMLGEQFALEPSVLVKYVDPVPPKLDANLTLRYKEFLWLGAGWRSNDAIPITVGFWLKRMFQFGYSYDITTTGLSQYAGGTHEVMLAVTFDKRPRPRGSSVPEAAAPVE